MSGGKMLGHEASKAAFRSFFAGGSDREDQDLLRDPTVKHQVEFVRRGGTAADRVSRRAALRYLALMCALHSLFNTAHTELMRRLAPWLFERSTMYPGKTHWEVACDSRITLDNFHLYFPGAFTHRQEWENGECIPVPHVRPAIGRGTGWIFYVLEERMPVPGVEAVRHRGRSLDVGYTLHIMMATLNSGPPLSDSYHASHMFNGVAGGARDSNPLNIRWELRSYNLGPRVDAVERFNEGLGEAASGAGLPADQAWGAASNLVGAAAGAGVPASDAAVRSCLVQIATPITVKSARELVYCVTPEERAIWDARRGTLGEPLPLLLLPPYATRLLGPHLYSMERAQRFNERWAMQESDKVAFVARVLAMPVEAPHAGAGFVRLEGDAAAQAEPVAWGLGMASAPVVRAPPGAAAGSSPWARLLAGCGAACAPGGGPIMVTAEGHLVPRGGVGGGETWRPAGGGGDAGASGSGGGGGLAGPSTMAAEGQAAVAAGGGVAPPARAGGFDPSSMVAVGGQAGGGGGAGGAQAAAPAQQQGVQLHSVPPGGGRALFAAAARVALGMSPKKG